MWYCSQRTKLQNTHIYTLAQSMSPSNKAKTVTLISPRRTKAMESIQYEGLQQIAEKDKTKAKVQTLASVYNVSGFCE